MGLTSVMTRAIGPGHIFATSRAVVPPKTDADQGNRPAGGMGNLLNLPFDIAHHIAHRAKIDPAGPGIRLEIVTRQKIAQTRRGHVRRQKTGNDDGRLAVSPHRIIGKWRRRQDGLRQRRHLAR
jgi:hypothetical protein